MITLRKSTDRGKSETDWLGSFHTFSFADYIDSRYMGLGALRVINEDTVKAGAGFGRHPHHDMEIISYVVDGELEHKDSMGHGSIIKRGEIQIMSAGTGIHHSESNHSKKGIVHFLQIWIIPDKKNLEPRYQQEKIHKIDNQLILIGSGSDDKKALVKINQDVDLFCLFLQKNNTLNYTLKENRIGWLQLIKGAINLNGTIMLSGDGAAIENETAISINAIEGTELLFFDLAH